MKMPDPNEIYMSEVYSLRDNRDQAMYYDSSRGRFKLHTSASAARRAVDIKPYGRAYKLEQEYNWEPQRAWVCFYEKGEFPDE